MTKTAKRTPGVYKTDEGWKHTKNSNAVWDDKISAETDYRFSCDWEKANA